MNARYPSILLWISKPGSSLQLEQLNIINIPKLRKFCSALFQKTCSTFSTNHMQNLKAKRDLVTRVSFPRFFPALWRIFPSFFSNQLSDWLVFFFSCYFFCYFIYLTGHCDDLSFGFTRLDWKVLPYDFHTYVWKSKRLLDIVPSSTGHSGQHFHRFLTGLRQFNSGHSINVQRILPSSHLHSGVQGPGDQRSPCSCCMPS